MSTVPALQPIEVLFLKSGEPLSKLIMWGTGEPASHVAIDVPDRATIVHSDLLGLHRAARKDFLEDHTTVAAFTLNLAQDDRDAVEVKLLQSVKAARWAPYDFPAFAYLGYRFALQKIRNIPVPSKNPWEEKGEYLCTEVTKLLDDALFAVTGRRLVPPGTDLGAVTPWKLRSLLISSAGGKNELDLTIKQPA